MKEYPNREESILAMMYWFRGEARYYEKTSIKKSLSDLSKAFSLDPELEECKKLRKKILKEIQMK